jgi:hypothetical protein
MSRYLPAKAVRAATAARRCHIASLIANGIANSTLSEDKLIFLLGVLDQINDSEIIYLGYFAQPNPEAQAALLRGEFSVAFVRHLSQVGLLEEDGCDMGRSHDGDRL